MHHKRTYGFAWSVTWLIAVLCLGCLFRAELRTAAWFAPPAPSAAAAEERTGADWFLLVRVPEITAQYESGVDTMKVRLGEWLEALSKAGFRPMRLSDIVRRLERGEPLPERAIALFFSPGYRRTYEIVAPIFRRYDCPAALLTIEAALKMSDRRYLSYHALRDISREQGWDCGFSDSAGSFTVEGTPGLKAARWSSTAGALALNRWAPDARFNYLTANADWLAGELVNRLRAETPVSGKTALTKAQVHGRDWGIVSDEKDAASAFDLQTSPLNRGAKLFWLSTLGKSDFRLSAKAGSLFGELWLQLRYDEASGDNVHVILSGHDMLIEEQRAHKAKRLAFWKQAGAFSDGPFTVDVTAQDGALYVSVDGGEPRPVYGMQPPAAGKGVVQVYLLDKTRGTARVRGLRLLFEPLEGSPAGRKNSSAPE